MKTFFIPTLPFKNTVNVVHCGSGLKQESSYMFVAKLGMSSMGDLGGCYGWRIRWSDVGCSMRWDVDGSYD